MKKNNNTFSNIKDIFKEVWNHPKGKAFLFFAFYFVFFTVLIISLRNSNNSSMESVEKQDLPYSFSNIIEKNYNFMYEINYGSIVTYEGQQYKNTSSFIKKDISQTEFYNSFDKYYTKRDTTWIETENPYLYTEFLDIYNIRDILKNSTYISKTEYASGKTNYQYQISTTTLVKLLMGSIIDLDDYVNTINVIVGENNQVEAFELLLSSYGMYTNNLEVLTIKISYSDFGKVLEIESPIVN